MFWLTQSHSNVSLPSHSIGVSVGSFLLIMPEFVAAAFACNLGIGLARIAQKGHDLPCFCETKK